MPVCNEKENQRSNSVYDVNLRILYKNLKWKRLVHDNDGMMASNQDWKKK